MLLLAALPGSLNAMMAKTTKASVASEYVTVLDEIERVETWTYHSEFDGITIEYRFEDCTYGRLDRQSVIFFQFTNTTNQTKTFEWFLEMWYDDACKNCHKQDSPEFENILTLKPGEVIAGSPDNTGDRSLYVFSHWARLVPGMTETKLTKFKFINMKTSVSK